MLKYDEEKFKNRSHGIPDQLLPSELKTPEWYKKNCFYLFHQYVNDRCAIPYSRITDFQLYRDYAAGRQSVVKYMDYLCPADQGGERKSYMNISWDILSVAPKFRDVVWGQFDKVDFTVNTVANDEGSVSKKEGKKYRIWAEKVLGMADMGMAAEEESVDPLVRGMDSIAELETFLSSKGIKLKEEIAIDKLIRFSFDLSNWREVKRQLFEDIYDLGLCTAREYLDSGGRSVVEYLDPAYVLLPYSKHRNYKNIDRWGVIQFKTISDIRIEAPELEEEQLYQMARSNAQAYGNPIINSYGSYYSNGAYNGGYDNCKIPVLYCEWEGADVARYKQKENKFGSLVSYKIPLDAQPKYERSKIKDVYTKITHCAYYVINSEVIYGYGVVKNIPRKNLKEPLLSIVAYRALDKSPVARCIALYDAIQLAWLKLQNAIAVAKPKGFYVDIGALEAVTTDGISLKPMEVLDIARQLGDVLYRRTDNYGNLNAQPIVETEGGIGGSLNEFITVLATNMNLIRDITGINQLADASTPNSETAVGTAQIAIQSTANALQPMFSAYESVKLDAANRIGMRWKALAMFGNIKGEALALGDEVTEIVKENSAIASMDMGVFLEALPSDEEKVEIKQAALEAQRVPLAEGGITHGDYLEICHYLSTGNVKLARLSLMMKDKKNRMQALQLQQAQAQAAMEQEQAKVQAEAQKEVGVIQAQGQVDMQKLQLEYQLKAELQNIINNGQLSLVQEKGRVATISQGQRTEGKLVQQDHKHEFDREKMATEAANEQALVVGETLNNNLGISK